MMGVRRTTVTTEAQSLAQTGMIQYRRGHITIINRDGLEECACECYTVIREETDRLMGAA
jgi:DNA-binding transcriptional regulator YhcF (GntR family)